MRTQSLTTQPVAQAAASPLPNDLKPEAAGVSLRAVTKRYGSVTAIKNISLEIPAGSYCCLLGPSGCGKTTALRMIAGHELASEGDIWIGDRPVTHLPPAQRNTAMMFQNYALFPHKTVWQNVDFGLKMRRLSSSQRQQRVGEMLELVGLSHTADRRPDALSGGQQQRIALARALVTRPQVLMLDEPLSALDENLRVRMRGELRKMQRQFGLTFIQVTHHVEEAFSLSDQIVVMSDGHIEQVASPTDLFNAPVSQFVAKFIGDNNIFEGRVANVVPDKEGKDLIELAIAHTGSLFCRGSAPPVNTQAACSIRPDLITLSPLFSQDPTPPSAQINSLIARITDIELTGYATRVLLAQKTTKKPLLYNVKTTDWALMQLNEGDQVMVQWSAQDCVFLSH